MEGGAWEGGGGADASTSGIEAFHFASEILSRISGWLREDGNPVEDNVEGGLVKNYGCCQGKALGTWLRFVLAAAGRC